MADERGIDLPKDTDWPHLRKQSGIDLVDDLRARPCARLASSPASSATSSPARRTGFSNPVNLAKLISLIDETEWTSLDVDVKAAAFEGLLEKAASEGKKGAGQYFTPRLLIQSIVRCIKPDPRASKQFTIGDPACGTGGFLVAAYEWLKEQTGGAFDRDDRQAHPHQHLLRPRTGRPAPAARADEPLPPPSRAAHHPRRLDLRGADQPAVRRDPDQPALRHQGR